MVVHCMIFFKEGKSKSVGNMVKALTIFASCDSNCVADVIDASLCPEMYLTIKQKLGKQMKS